MDKATIAVAFQTVVSIVILSVVVRRLFTLRVDRLRQALFEVRDDLFDFAAAGGIAFDHPAYATLRRMLNGLIRHAHHMGVIHVVATLLFSRQSLRSGSLVFEARWKEACTGLSEDTQSRLKAYRRRANVLVARHVVTAWGFVLLLGVIGSAWIAGHVGTWIRNKGNRIRDDIDTLGLACGGN